MVELTFEHVRKGKGRIHLAVSTAPGDPVETLCGKSFGAGEYDVVEGDADCTACERRRADPGAVSSAFFAHGEGSRLLELALAQAGRRSKPASKPAPAKKASPAPAKPPPPPPPARVGELSTAGFKEAEGGVWRSSGGVIVRMAGERLAELIAEGQVRVVRKGSRVRVAVADVQLELDADTLRITSARRSAG